MLYVPVVMLVAAAAVLAGVIAVALGRGGELALFQADYAPVKLGEVSATDVVLFRPPLALWGYSVQATDEALNRIAEALTERDIEIAALRQKVANLEAASPAGRQRAYGLGHPDRAGVPGSAPGGSGSGPQDMRPPGPLPRVSPGGPGPRDVRPPGAPGSRPQDVRPPGGSGFRPRDARMAGSPGSRPEDGPASGPVPRPRDVRPPEAGEEPSFRLGDDPAAQRQSPGARDAERFSLGGAAAAGKLPPGDRPPGDSPEGRAQDSAEGPAEDSPEGRAQDSPEGRAQDSPEGPAEDSPEGRAQDPPRVPAGEEDGG